MWILHLVFCVSAYAAKSAYPAQEIRAAGLTQIKVTGVKGHLSFRHRAGESYRIKVSHSKKVEDWGLSVDRNKNELVLEVYNVTTGARWRDHIHGDRWPEFDVEIEGPSIPVLISWREGQFTFHEWRSPVEASLLKGRLESRAGQGAWKLQVMEGDVRIDRHEGELSLNGERGSVHLAQTKGGMKVNWLSGELQGRDLSGPIDIEMNSGFAVLKGVGGSLNVRGGAASWEIQGKTPGELDVVTETGDVRLQWVGATRYFLTSTTGKFALPKGFKVQTREGFQVVEGTRAKPPYAQVFVRTRSGQISFQ